MKILCNCILAAFSLIGMIAGAAWVGLNSGFNYAKMDSEEQKAGE